jgi:hypothetical protein
VEYTDINASTSISSEIKKENSYNSIGRGQSTEDSCDGSTVSSRLLREVSPRTKDLMGDNPNKGSAGRLQF